MNLDASRSELQTILTIWTSGVLVMHPDGTIDSGQCRCWPHPGDFEKELPGKLLGHIPGLEHMDVSSSSLKSC